jgi:hypothetical protein
MTMVEEAKWKSVTEGVGQLLSMKDGVAIIKAFDQGADGKWKWAKQPGNARTLGLSSPATTMLRVQPTLASSVDALRATRRSFHTAGERRPWLIAEPLQAVEFRFDLGRGKINELRHEHWWQARRTAHCVHHRCCPGVGGC